jgi:uncharacterized membrane protein required for colicin V production
VNPIDAIVLILLLVGVLSGARAGFLGPVLGLLGGIGGFAVALVMASLLREALLEVEQPARAFVTLLGLGAFVFAGEAAGTTLGTSMSRGMRIGPLRPLDMFGGALVGAGHVVLFVWLVGGVLSMGLAPSLGPTARDSVALRIAAERLPDPGSVAGGVLALLDTTDLPQLFAGLEPEPAPPVDLPADADTLALARSATASTAKVTSTGCGPGLAVGSSFFVSSAHAVTNAHVVAGSTTTTVRIGGADRNAIVVAFDTAADLALLFVEGADAPALRLSGEAPSRGTTGAVLGHPGGGDLAVTGAAVTATYQLPGPDIYGEGRHTRTVVEMRSQIRRGNSGGPLVVAPGIVGAIIFGASESSPDVGYAIGADEAVERIGPIIGSTTPVDTGACL